MQCRYFAKIIFLLSFERKKPKTKQKNEKNLRKGVEKEGRNIWIRNGFAEAKICNRVQGCKGACRQKYINHVSYSDRYNIPKNFWELKYM